MGFSEDFWHVEKLSESEDVWEDSFGEDFKPMQFCTNFAQYFWVKCTVYRRLLLPLIFAEFSFFSVY